MNRSEQLQSGLEPLEARQLLAAHAISTFFPLANADTWQYSGTLNGEPATASTRVATGRQVGNVRTTKITTTITQDGATALVDERFYAHTPSGFRFYQHQTTEDGQTESMVFGDGLRYLPRVVNDGSSYAFNRALTGTTDDGRRYTGTFQGDVTILGLEDIPTQAGVFEALRVMIDGEITIQGEGGWTAHGVVTESRWLARNVGTVRFDYAEAIDFENGTIESTRFNMGLTEAGRVRRTIDLKVEGTGIVIPLGDSTPEDVDGTKFGNVDLNGQRLLREFKITNTSDSAITLFGTGRQVVRVNGNHANSFAVTRQPAKTLAPGASSTFVVRFDPSARGKQTGIVTIATGANRNNPFTFMVDGSGVVLGRTTVTGGPRNQAIVHNSTQTRPANGTHLGSAVAEGDATITRTFTIRNTGAGPLVFDPSARVTISGEDAGDFSVVSQPAQRLRPGRVTRFTLSFNPAEVGRRTATVTILTNDPMRSAFTFTISGTGLAST